MPLTWLLPSCQRSSVEVSFVGSTPLVILFVDALPADAFARVGAGQWDVSAPMMPGLGYSLNVKAEMFAGLTPDELGVFNEYQRVNDRRKRSGAFLGFLDKWPVLAWGVRRAVSRVARVQLSNIPFAWQSEFARRGVNAYEPAFDRTSLFSTGQVFRVGYSDLGRVDDRDAVVGDRLTRALGERHSVIFAAMPDLDRTLHQTGFSPQVERRLEFYTRIVEQVRSSATSLVLCSDHGMCAVEDHIDVNAIMSRFATDEMRWFIDSTMLRVWGGTAGRLDSLRQRLDELGVRTLTAEDRQEYAVRNPAFGSLIAVAPIGSVFSPNFYGRSQSKAMHGYLPEDPSQWGGVAASGPVAEVGRAVLSSPCRPVGVYEFLTRAVAESSKSI